MSTASPSPGPHDTMVLVVGAGPVGLLAACELSRRQLPVRLIDKLPAATDESRAILVFARSLEMLEQVGVLDALVASGITTTAMELRDGRRLLVRMDLDTVDSAFPFAVTTAQTETERVLTERLGSLGGSVVRGVELVALEQDEAGVTSTVRSSADGGTTTIRSAYVIGADGGHSKVRDAVGARLEGSFKGERFVLGDVEADHDLQPDAMRTYFSSSDGPLLVFPMKGERVRLIAEVPADNDSAPAPTLDGLQSIVDARAGDIHIRTSHWLTTFDIHHAQVPQYRHGRVFLAGDAAHVHSPAGGQGMNTGLQDAFNLTWKLAATLQGSGGELLLDSYQAERHPVAARVLTLTTRLTHVGTIDHGVARWLRNEAMHAASGLAPVRHALADQIGETDLAYRGSPIVVGPGHARGRHHLRAGDHAPYVPGVPLREQIVTRGPGGAGETGHVLVTMSASSDVPTPLRLDGTREILVAPTADPVDGYDAVVADLERLVADRYGLPSGGRVLVRPDGYIGLITGLDDPDACTAYVHRLTD